MPLGPKITHTTSNLNNLRNWLENNQCIDKNVQSQKLAPSPQPSTSLWEKQIHVSGFYLSLLTWPTYIASVLNIGQWSSLPGAEASSVLCTVPIRLRATLYPIRQTSIGSYLFLLSYHSPPFILPYPTLPLPPILPSLYLPSPPLLRALPLSSGYSG